MDNLLQKQIDVLNKKVDLILAELGKKCDYHPEEYTLSDAEEEGETPTEEAAEGE